MFTSALSATPPHAVTSLPGYGAPPTKHWTGFVEVDAASKTHFFFYLVESAGDPAKDPLVWWMNGGPGASSFAGLFGENGPLLLNATGALTPNPFAWNRRANVLYVEFGPGIGFSYCANSSRAGPCPQASADCSPCYTSDDTLAMQNAALLESLLAHTFPALAGRKLYLAGESCEQPGSDSKGELGELGKLGELGETGSEVFGSPRSPHATDAGVYIPTLARELLRSTSGAVNLSGLWVTDPCTDNEAQVSLQPCASQGGWSGSCVSSNRIPHRPPRSHPSASHPASYLILYLTSPSSFLQQLPCHPATASLRFEPVTAISLVLSSAGWLEFSSHPFSSHPIPLPLMQAGRIVLIPSHPTSHPTHSP